MLYNETAVRENLRNREGKRVFYLGKGDNLTSGARDYLARERIEILPAEAAKPDAYRLLSGGLLTEKPEHMTHLHGNVLVEKTHPRIAFRGAVDNLEGWLLLTQQQCPAYLGDLSEILNLARTLIRADVLNEPLPEGKLCGLSQKEIRERSHRPQDFYGVPHFMPSAADGTVMIWLNLCRSVARQTELAAAGAFTDENGCCTRPDILKALNRTSSMLYLLMIREKAKK